MQWSAPGLPPRVLQLYRAGDRYSVWMFYDAAAFRNWYINFEAPTVRRPETIDTLDYNLALVIEADRSRKWKDVEDLNALRRVGRMTLEEISACPGGGSNRQPRPVVLPVSGGQGADSCHTSHLRRPSGRSS